MKTRFDQMKEQLAKKTDEDKRKTLMSSMDEEYRILCLDDADHPKDMLRHLHNNIYPVVAAFRALMKNGMPREEASSLSQETFLGLMESSAASIQKLCKIPGFYKLVPSLFGKLMPKLFKKEAGFEFKFHPTDASRVQFDMLRCPYFQVCKDLDCPELSPVFCATDDICYGHMHPNLIWNRTKTLARGDDLCNFDLEVKKP